MKQVCFRYAAEADKCAVSWQIPEFTAPLFPNAFFHIRDQWDEIEKECRRVLKRTGILYVIGTWSLDTILMIEMFGDQAFWQAGFLLVRIEKE